MNPMLARWTTVSFTVCLLAPAAVAHGADDPLPRGGVALDAYDADWVPAQSPGAASDLDGASRPTQGDPHVIYLNYDGATINQGNRTDDSRTNTSTICSGEFTPFGEGQVRDASIQATRRHWEAYNVSIVTERPDSGDYTMNVIGGGNTCGTGFVGYAPGDCENRNPNDIVFTFATGDGRFSSEMVASINSQEIGHAYGLMHVNQPADIMNPTTSGNVQSFTDECHDIVDYFICEEQHARHCGVDNRQNAHQELLELIGPAAADGAPPTVSITSPLDGDVLGAPASFTVTADASDDRGIAEVRLLLDGVDQNSPDDSAPYAWDLADVPVGTYTFEAVARDTAGNETTSAPVTLEVTPDGGSGSGDGDGDGDGDSGDGDGDSGGGDGDGDGDGDSGGDGDGSGSGGDGDSDGQGPGFDPWGDGTEGEGCSCATSGDAPAAMALLLVGVLGLRRRS